MDEHVARLAAVTGTDDAGSLELVNDTAGPVVAKLQFTLQERGASKLATHDKSGSILKIFINVFGVKFLVWFFILIEVFGQFKSLGIAALVANGQQTN